MRTILIVFMVLAFGILLINGVVQTVKSKIKTKKYNEKIKAIRDAAYDEALNKCRKTMESGEVVYLSKDDLFQIIESIK